MEKNIYDLNSFTTKDANPRVVFDNLLIEAQNMLQQNGLHNAKIEIGAVQFTIIHGDKKFSVVAQVAGQQIIGGQPGTL